MFDSPSIQLSFGLYSTIAKRQRSVCGFDKERNVMFLVFMIGVDINNTTQQNVAISSQTLDQIE